MTYSERLQIEALLSNPEKLIVQKPFFRSVKTRPSKMIQPKDVDMTGYITPALPQIKRETVTQLQFMRELDVYSHDVLFDENIPSITMKLKDGGYWEMTPTRMAIPFQKLILNKQTRHLCVNTMDHTLLNTAPTEKQQKDFIRYKQGWDKKNMEGAKTKFVKTQKSYGIGGLLYYMTEDGYLGTKIISFEDGYVILTHKDDTGKHILECLYYNQTDEDGNITTYLDCYDDEKMTRFTNVLSDNSDGGWVRHESVEHGFSENPLITKRGDVAWNNGQSIINAYEILFNTIIVVQKKFALGALYVKGKINPTGQKVAGMIVLNDTSGDANSDAKVLNPVESSQQSEILKNLERSIMIATGTTFILPEDIRISGDASGLAIEMTQELDMATAQDGVAEWQNVANKMARLFKEGYAKELVNHGEHESAITDFASLDIQSKFRVWKPKSEESHNQMLATLHGSGGISTQTYVEKNTVSTPDEMMRIQKENEAKLKEQENQGIFDSADNQN